MEIKYTIEILTKDIQDIEKLVENLSNSKDNSAIELDLALSKLRNVYEILTMIKTDRLHELISQNPFREQLPSEAAPAAKPEPATIPGPEPEPFTDTVSESDPSPEAAAESATPPEAAAESATPSEVVAESGPKPETKSKTEPSDRSILAEKFSKESSINENLAEKRKVNLDTKLIGQSIDNIMRNIGINDRFFIIRELFKGDSDQFNNLVNKLDSAESYQDATTILKEQFPESMDHEGVEILSGLVKRRHIR